MDFILEQTILEKFSALNANFVRGNFQSLQILLNIAKEKED